MKKKSGKWRRAEEQLTVAQRRMMGEMLRDGYTIAACMERFGLTDKEQVFEHASKPVSSLSANDRASFNFSHRTTFAEVARDHVWKGSRTKYPN